MQRVSIFSLVILAIISSIITALLTSNYLGRQSEVEANAIADARTQAQDSAEIISLAFNDVMTIANQLADDLSDGSQSYENITDRLNAEITDRPDIDGLAITFEPFAYDPDMRLYQEYIYKTEDGAFDMLVGASYDYSLPPDDDPETPNTTWYYNTVQNGANWLEPFFATGAQKVLVEYAVPFYAVDDADTVAGIVTIDYSLNDVDDLLEELELGSTGYGFVISAQGTILAHPVSDYVIRQSIFDIIEADNLTEAVQTAIDGTAQFIDTIDPVTNIETWQFLEPIGTTGWTVGIVLNQDEFLLNPNQLVKEQVTIALSGALTIFFILTTVFYFDGFDITGLWAASNVFSVLCLLLIIFIIWLTSSLHKDTGLPIHDDVQLERYLESFNQSLAPTDIPIEIPTGILIQAMDFPDPTSVTINGIIWQDYPVGADIQVGFALPRRIGEEATIEQISHEINGDVETYVWYIGVTMRQIYDVTKFPFDNRNIIVPIAPLDLKANIILTPDFEPYNFINPVSLPGVDTDVDINNWHFTSSGFSYLNKQQNINLSLSDNVTQTIPELIFSVQAKRNYLGPFIAYLLPGVIAAAMMFTYLVAKHQEGDEDEIVGALNYAAALFFVVAVIHTGLRSQIAAVGITYLEYVYILLYLAIVLVAANVFVVARYPDWFIVRYRKNIIPKLLYWAVFTGALLLITLVLFVY